MKIFTFAVACLSAYLKRYGFKNIKVMCITNKEFECGTYERVFKESICSYTPNIVCFSVMTNHWGMVKILSTWIKEISDTFIICGGYHPTLFPEDVVTNPHIDAVNVGEGEESLLDVVKGLPEKPSKIKNILTRDNGSIVKNALRPLILDMDTLPYPDREIFIENNINGMGKTIIEEFVPDKNVVTMNTSRGCLFSCSYCSNHAVRALYTCSGAKNFIRKRSVGNLVDEMHMLNRRFHPDYFEFQDELFPLDKIWLEEFKSRYASIGIPFAIHLRIGTVDEERLSLLRESGSFMVYIGLECGNEKYRKEILNKSFSNELVIKNFKKLRKLGFKIVTYNMVGLPFETNDLIKETVHFNKVLSPDYPLFFSYQPLPGTRLYEVSIEHDLIKDKDAYGNYYRQEPRLKVPISEDELKERWRDICDLQKHLTGKTQGFF